jgi:hypothetical protein
MPRTISAAEKVRAAAAKRGYIAPLDPLTVPADIRAAIAAECGVSRQAVPYALAKKRGARQGRPTSASHGRAKSKLDTAAVVGWLRAFAKGKSAPVVAALMAAAMGIEKGHVHTWTDLDGKPLD